MNNLYLKCLFYHTIEGQLHNNINTNRRIKVLNSIHLFQYYNERIIGAILGGHNVSGIGFDVALVDMSPPVTPQIADDPVVDSVESAISDQDDCVIH